MKWRRRRRRRRRRRAEGTTVKLTLRGPDTAAGPGKAYTVELTREPALRGALKFLVEGYSDEEVVRYIYIYIERERERDRQTETETERQTDRDRDRDRDRDGDRDRESAHSIYCTLNICRT